MNNSSPTIERRRFSWRLFSIIMSIIAIFAILIGCSANWSFPDWIFIAGSSTMQPLLDEVSKMYKEAEISITSGGSAFGINSVLDNKKNIGSVAKMPSVNIAGLPGQSQPNETAQEWKNESIKTVTLGKDSIGIIYKDSNLLNNKNICINEDNIATLYLAFCGHNKIYLNQLSTNLPTNYFLVPFARAGGSNESGTAESFLLDNYLGINGSSTYLQTIDATKNQVTPIPTGNKTESVFDVLEHGNYGLNVVQTNETSLETWEAIKSYTSSSPYAIPITYLSSGFIKNNYKEITKYGFKIASYSNANIELLNQTSTGYEINTKYNWFRPLNLVLKTKNNFESKKLVEWMIGNILFADSQINKLFNGLGFITLTPTQMLTMFNPKNLTSINELIAFAQANPQSDYQTYLKSHKVDWESLWISDYNIYPLQQQIRQKTKEYYGAIIRE